MIGPKEQLRHDSARETLFDKPSSPTAPHPRLVSNVAKAKAPPENSGSPVNQRAANPLTVAAVIPLYNGADFITAAIESVIAQADRADEIIVVDDGSTDDGPGIVRQLAEKYPITVLTKANGGQSSARNLGISQSTCTHIALLDQDDIWYPHHLASLKNPFLNSENRRLGFVYGNLDRIDKAGYLVRRNFLDEVASPHPKMSVLQCVSQDMFILPGASMFPKQVWIDVGGFDERLSGYEDDDFFFRIFRAGYTSDYLKDDAVMQWRIYPGSTSFSPRMAKSRMLYFRKLMEVLPDEPKLHLFWGRDAIGPRFLGNLRGEFILASRERDLNRVKQCWSDLKEVIPVLRGRAKRRLKILAPIIGWLHQTRFQAMARLALRTATRG